MDFKLCAIHRQWYWPLRKRLLGIRYNWFLPAIKTDLIPFLHFLWFYAIFSSRNKRESCEIGGKRKKRLKPKTLVIRSIFEQPIIHTHERKKNHLRRDGVFWVALHNLIRSLFEPTKTSCHSVTENCRWN